MNTKEKRLQAIEQIVASKEISKQEDICAELNRLGFNVTQATVSRDLKELNLCKVAGHKNKFRYANTDTYMEGVTDRMTALFKSSVLSINSANNLIVIKAMRGNASSVGVFVDSLQMPQIIGSVAGDDNVLIVVDSNEDTPEVEKILKSYLE
ncbi:MAG: arginine repressor [Clostridia bacterium]|nr:arginine repressor [Clostridia bacterium]